MDLWSELKRRRVVQALLAYGATFFIVLQVADLTFDALGLPGWVYRFTVVTGIVGFPTIAVVSWIYDLRAGALEATPSEDAPGGTGRRIRLAVWALPMGLALLASGALATWALQSMRPGTLVAQGLLEQGDEIVLGDILGSEASMAGLVTEALRVALGSSPTFSLLEPARAREAVERMERDPEAPIDAEVARQIALREGAKGYVSGTIGPLGSRCVLVADISAAETGEVLVSFREVAEDDDDLIDAIDRLADRMRLEIGESLASVREQEPLRQVTTASLPALRAYTEGRKAYDRGQPALAVASYRDAIALDSGFAMAWTGLGPVLQSTASELEWHEAVRRGFELRDRLPPRERYQVESRYHDILSGNVDAELYALERSLQIEPNRAGTLSNYARALGQHYARYDEAAEYMQRALEINNEFASAANIVWVRIFQGRMEAAAEASEHFRRSYPSTFWRFRGPFFVAYHEGDAGAAMVAADSMQADARTPARWRSRARFYMSLADELAGRHDLAVERLREEMWRAHEAGAPELALARAMDLVWLEGVVAGDTAAARGAGRVALEQGWFDASPEGLRPAFRTVRDLARAGLPELAREFLERWTAQGPAELDWSYDEDLAAARALLAGAEGDPAGAAATLTWIQDRTGPRYTQTEWPSARHCQRCWLFDIARLRDAADQPDSARGYYRRVLEETEDIVETPINRVLAERRLAELGEG